MFKIFAFEDRMDRPYEPFWESTVQRFKTPICLYYRNRHYHAIERLTTFFKIHKYCFHCRFKIFIYIKNVFIFRRPYCQPLTHICLSRCEKCCDIINGLTPCVAEDGFIVECAGCFKTFTQRLVFCK
jgi:hypothetical protein